MPQPSLICFDLGGVLVQLVSGWQQAAELAGVAWTADPASLGPAWARHQDLAHALELGRLDEPSFEAAVKECFPGLDCSHYWRIFDAWLIRLYPTVPELLADLKRAGLTTAVLSNTNARHWRTLLAGDYAPLTQIDHLIASHLISARKPDLPAYRHVEQVTNTPPDRILFFDDKPENIQSAHAAGWQADLIDPTQDGPTQIRAHLGRRGILPQ
jgi:HAD superfamily hydrolase (TIGR01509 family)